MAEAETNINELLTHVVSFELSYLQCCTQFTGCPCARLWLLGTRFEARYCISEPGPQALFLIGIFVVKEPVFSVSEYNLKPITNAKKRKHKSAFYNMNVTK
jgi:hypothetical protein